MMTKNIFFLMIGLMSNNLVYGQYELVVDTLYDFENVSLQFPFDVKTDNFDNFITIHHEWFIQSDVFITSFDSLGNQNWQYEYQGNLQNDFFLDNIILESNEIVNVVNTQISDNPEFPVGFKSGVFKIGSSGLELWRAELLPDSSYYGIVDFSINEIGEILVVGFKKNIPYQNESITFVAKFTDDGDLEWIKDFPGSNGMKIRCKDNQFQILSRHNYSEYEILNIDYSGSVIDNYSFSNQFVSGWQLTMVDSSFNTYMGRFHHGYEISKFSNSGELLWMFNRENESNSTVNDRILSMQVDELTNTIYATGMHYKEENGISNLFIVAIDIISGNLIWEEYFREEEFLTRGDEIFINENKLFVTGIIYADEIATNNVIVFDKLTGELIYSQASESNQGRNENLNNISVSNNNVCVFGFEGENQSNEVYAKLKIFKNNNVTDANDLYFNSTVVIYPNPSQDEIIIESPYLINEIKLLDQYGRTAYTGNVDGYSKLLNVERLVNGIYTVKILLHNRGQISKKIIKN